MPEWYQFVVLEPGIVLGQTTEAQASTEFIMAGSYNLVSDMWSDSG